MRFKDTFCGGLPVVQQLRIAKAFGLLSQEHQERFWAIAGAWRVLKMDMRKAEHTFTNFRAEDLEPRLASMRSSLNPASIEQVMMDGEPMTQEDRVIARREGRERKIRKRRNHD